MADEAAEEDYSYLYELIDEVFGGLKLTMEYKFFAHMYGIDGHERYSRAELA